MAVASAGPYASLQLAAMDHFFCPLSRMTIIYALTLEETWTDRETDGQTPDRCFVLYACSIFFQNSVYEKLLSLTNFDCIIFKICGRF